MRTIDLSLCSAQRTQTADRTERPTPTASATHRQSVLQIAVPVVVTLAETKETVERIRQLVPGSILRFDQSCDAPLPLAAGSKTIAHGQCVQIGDRWGLQIASLARSDPPARPAAQ